MLEELQNQLIDGNKDLKAEYNKGLWHTGPLYLNPEFAQADNAYIVRAFQYLMYSTQFAMILTPQYQNQFGLVSSYKEMVVLFNNVFTLIVERMSIYGRNISGNAKRNFDVRLKQLKSNLSQNDLANISKEFKKPKNQGCYVATCVYGSYDCPQVWTLRRFRDYKLNRTWYGRLFIKTYYAISPTLVKLFGKTEWFKKMWRGKLDRMVKKYKAKGFEDTPYNDLY